MNRLPTTRLLSAFVLLLCLSGIAWAEDAPAAAAKPPARPNILLIVADDQRFDTIHALGNDEIDTPTLDRLVARGFTFSNVYCQGSMMPAVCAPSRTMLLTGKSLFRIPEPAAKTYDGPTLGGVFQQAGWRTLCVSKPSNSFAVGHRAFDSVVHVPHVGAATNERCADAAIKFIQEQPGDRPFFIYYAPSMPHDPRTAESEYHRRYDAAKLTLSKNFLPRHPFDNGELDVRDEKLAAVPRVPEEMRQHLADYYACITSLDHHIGRVLAALEKSGQLDNTLVVFTSDQGLAVGGRHGLMGKQNLYEHFKSPLVIAGPGIPHGKSDALVYLFDLFPTLCDYAGIATPKVCEGTSLLPMMRGGSERQPGRDVLFAAYRDVQRMVRDRSWKLIWYPKIERFQLFDVASDPHELHDRSGDSKHAEQLAAMKKRLAEQQDAWGDKLPERPTTGE